MGSRAQLFRGNLQTNQVYPCHRNYGKSVKHERALMQILIIFHFYRTAAKDKSTLPLPLEIWLVCEAQKNFDENVASTSFFFQQRQKTNRLYSCIRNYGECVKRESALMQILLQIQFFHDTRHNIRISSWRLIGREREILTSFSFFSNVNEIDGVKTWMTSPEILIYLHYVIIIFFRFSSITDQQRQLTAA